jgi:hypothetical protein
MTPATPPSQGEAPLPGPKDPSVWQPGESLFGEERGKAPAEPAQGLWTLLAGVFTEPGTVFARLRRGPSWVMPLVLGVAVAVVAGLAWAHKVDMEAQVRASMETTVQAFHMNIPEEAIQKNLDAIHGQPYLRTALGTLFGMPFFAALMALVLWGFSRLGAEGDEDSTYVQSLSVVSVHYLAMVPATLLALLVGGGSLMHLMPTHLGFFVHPENPWARGLLALVDPFYLWSWVLLAIGMRRTLAMRTGAIVGALLLFGVFSTFFRTMGGMF